MGMDPVSIALIASAAAQMGGSFLQNKANNQTQQAMYDESQRANNATLNNQIAAKTAENARQDQLYNKGKAEAQASTDAATADKVMQGTGSEAARIMSQNTAQVDKRMAGGEFNIDPAVLAGAPSIITDAAGATAKKSEKNARDIGEQSANIQAPASSFATLGQYLQQQGNKINVANNFARGSSNVLPLEMQAGIVAPRQIKPASSTLGTILSGLGQLGSAATGAGMFNPSASVTTVGAPVAKVGATAPTVAATGLPYNYGKPMTQNVFAA